MDGITSEEGRDLSVSSRRSRRNVGDADFRAFQVDMIRTVTLPHLHLFGIEDGLELQVSSLHASVWGYHG
jgi:hypothetical protein